MLLKARHAFDLWNLKLQMLEMWQMREKLHAVGYDNIDVAVATERGILITNTPGVLTETTADFTWALIMASARRVVEADRFLREGHWKQ